MSQMSLKRAFGLTTAATLSLAAAGAIIALLAGDIDETGWKAILTSLIVSGGCLFSMSGAALIDRAQGPVRLVGQVTVACALACAAVLLVATWGEEAASPDWFERLVGCMSIVTVGLAHVSLLLVLRRPTDSAFTQRSNTLALVAGVVATLTAIAPVAGLFDVDDMDDFYWRLLGCEAVLLALTTALSLIARKFFTLDIAPAPATEPEEGEHAPGLSEVMVVPAELADHIKLVELDGGGALERWDDGISGWAFRLSSGAVLYDGGLAAPGPHDRVTNREVTALAEDFGGDEDAARDELVTRYEQACMGTIEHVWRRAVHYGYAPPR